MNIDLTNIAHVAAVLFGSGCAGMVAHSINKWRNKQSDSPLSYLLQDNLRATVGSLMSLMGAVGTAVFTDALTGMTIGQLILLAFPWGYANDSLVNKGAPAAQ